MLNDLQAHKLIGASGGGGSAEPPLYSRPADWLPLPTITEADEKIVGLFPVFNIDVNLVAFVLEGDYTVDWGDGVSENYQSGTKAQHNYSWNDIQSSTLTSEGFRQVLITVTPSIGQQLTYVSLDEAHDDTYYTNQTIPWLDLAMSLPNLAATNSIKLSSGWNGNWLSNLQKIHIYNLGLCESIEYLFFECTNLCEVTIENVPNVTTLTNVVRNCYSLKKLVIKNLVSLPGVSTQDFTFPPISGPDQYMIEHLELHDLNSAIYFDFTEAKGHLTLTGLLAVNDLYNFCTNWQDLVSIEIQGIEHITYIGGMFEDCYFLKKATISAPNATSASEMFKNCYSLEEVTLSDTSNLTDATYMFQNCISLKHAPLFDTSSVIYMSYMFSDCRSLATIPEYNTSSVETMNTMFNNCYSLLTIPLIDTSNVIDFSDMFTYCTGLRYLPALNTSSGTFIQSILYYGYNNGLAAAPFQGTKSSIDYTYCSLSRNAIIDIFNGLAVVEGETINLNSCYGVDDLTTEDIEIATNKGWTVLY